VSRGPSTITGVAAATTVTSGPSSRWYSITAPVPSTVVSREYIAVAGALSVAGTRLAPAQPARASASSVSGHSNAAASASAAATGPSVISSASVISARSAGSSTLLYDSSSRSTYTLWTERDAVWCTSSV